MTVGFVTYPPAAIGCTFKTPPVLGAITRLGEGLLFISTSAPGSRPMLKNDWKVETIEVTGGQWNTSCCPWLPGEARVAFRTSETPKPSRTYNFRVTKMVLSHGNANKSCTTALDEAF
jgi:hypothetical protein